MKTATLEALFWEEIDGPPSAERRRRIDALVQEQPGLESVLAELQGLADSLTEVGEVPPPLALRAGVRRGVASRAALGGSAKPGLADRLRPLTGAGWRARLAVATLAVLVAVVGLHLVTGWPWSMGEQGRSRPSGALDVVGGASREPFELTLEGSTATLWLFTEGWSLPTDARPTSDNPLRVTLRRPGGGLGLVQVEGERVAAPEASSRGDSVTVLAQGEITLTLELAGLEAPLDLRVETAQGLPVLEARIDLGSACAE